MERIAMENCALVLQDTNLVIPDNEFGVNLMDKVIGDVVGGSSSSSNPLPTKRRRINETKSKAATLSQKRKLLELVNGIVEEVHLASNSISNIDNQGEKAVENTMPISTRLSQPISKISENEYSNIININELSESDFSSDGMTERFLRESSIDHLLPEKPDYEFEKKQQKTIQKAEEQKVLLSETEESSQTVDSNLYNEIRASDNFETNAEAANKTEDIFINLEIKNTELTQVSALSKNINYENVAANIS